MESNHEGGSFPVGQNGSVDDALSAAEPDGEAGPPTRNAIDGDASSVVQAGTISGGVHFHGVSTTPRPVGRRIAEWDPFDLDVHLSLIHI